MTPPPIRQILAWFDHTPDLRTLLRGAVWCHMHARTSTEPTSAHAWHACAADLAAIIRFRRRFPTWTT